MNKKKLGLKLKVARIERELNQQEVQALTGIMQRSLSNYEHGRALLTIPTLQKLAKCYKKDITYFLEGTD